MNPHPVNTLQDVNNDELKAERSEKVSERLREGRKEEERKDRKEVITQESEKAEGTRSNGTERWRGPVCMHLGARKGPRRERDRRCGRDEARPSNVARSVVVRRTGASASCPSSSPKVRRSSYIAFRLLPRLPCFSWDDDLSLLDFEIFWRRLPKRGVCFRLAFVHWTKISLSLFRNIKHTVSTVCSLFRTESVRASSSFFFLSTCERNNK